MTTVSFQEQDGDTIIGGTDGTLIGNTGDKLKTEVSFSGGEIAKSSAFSCKTRVEVQTSTINLVTATFTNVFSYSGSGLLYGFSIEFNNSSIIPQLKIDGETIFTGHTISILGGYTVTANSTDRRQAGHGLVITASTVDWSLKSPIRYATSIEISADANGGTLLARSFTGGIIYLSKET